jgi:hypothetical protein
MSRPEGVRPCDTILGADLGVQTAVTEFSAELAASGLMEIAKRGLFLKTTSRANPSLSAKFQKSAKSSAKHVETSTKSAQVTFSSVIL